MRFQSDLSRTSWNLPKSSVVYVDEVASETAIVVVTTYSVVHILRMIEVGELRLITPLKSGQAALRPVAPLKSFNQP